MTSMFVSRLDSALDPHLDRVSARQGGDANAAFQAHGVVRSALDENIEDVHAILPSHGIDLAAVTDAGRFRSSARPGALRGHRTPATGASQWSPSPGRAATSSPTGSRLTSSAWAMPRPTPAADQTLFRAALPALARLVDHLAGPTIEKTTSMARDV